ncbi:type II secretion system protein GspM [Psychrobacter arenosus]|uniref:type II secretion system protein GspM n=1 Tax=Psychrobacter arenosus TaxID=256326 RepID=UPI00191A1C15|nr:type II secretion system protein GspM [Psychrobacter arenosus]
MLKKDAFRKKTLASRAARSETAPSALGAAVARQPSPLAQRYGQWQQQLETRWQALPPRDRLALSVLIAFLLLFSVGYGGYTIHSEANKSKTAYNTAVADYFWLRSQAGNIDVNASNNSQAGGKEDAAQGVNDALRQAGVQEAQVAAVGTGVQMSFSNDSQTVVARILGQLQQQGWQFSRLNVQQDPTSKQLQVQATLAR